FYPCVNYTSVKGDRADNSFNCPVVATYPEVLRGNMESLEEDGVRFISPFVNLRDPAKVEQMLVDTFADWNVTLAEAKAAV
ncbi:acyl-CoA dehydratase activase-related protein, partial [Pauljensenia sp. UMB0018B]|nr:acyl-CoA dehydratase activase-related protein [Pauljensenia sp. UMB0018B]